MHRSRVGLSELVERENLALAFVETRRGKALDPGMLAFRSDLDANLGRLGAAILEQSYAFGPYRSFEITDPKTRLIHAAPFADRVVHHALVRVTENVFEAHQVFDSYACRKGKGTHAAVLRAFHYARLYPFFLKLDVRKYYDSIDHGFLFGQLERKFKDPGLLFLMYRLIESYESRAGKGLPIGNLTSQYWANHYLADLDHLIKDRLRLPAYVRYMDDMVIFSRDRPRLLELRTELGDFLESHLALSLKIASLGNLRPGLSFLGFTIRPTGIYLAKRSRDRFRKKLRELQESLEAGEIDETEAQARSQALVAFTLIARARRFRASVITSL